MSDKDTYAALYHAFVVSGQALGSDLKKLSSLYRNWKVRNKAAS